MNCAVSIPEDDYVALEYQELILRVAASITALGTGLSWKPLLRPEPSRNGTKIRLGGQL